jgi:ABC-2 type transport system permease protein
MTAASQPEQPRRSFLRLLAVVARRDYLRTVRRRGFIFGTAMLPAAMIGFTVLSTLFAPAMQPVPPPSLSVVNESAVAIRAPAGMQVALLDRAAAEAALGRGDITEFYVIPAGYPADPQVARVSGASSPPGIDQLQRHVAQEQALAVVLRASLVAGSSLPPSVGERLIQPFVLHELSGGGAPTGPGAELGFGFLLPYLFTILFVLSIFITSGYLLQSVTEEKENRVVEILLSSVPPGPLMAGKVLGLGAAGLTQVAIWVATALAALPLVVERVPALSGVSVSPTLLLLSFLFFVLGYLAYGAIFAAIGAIAPGTREAQQYSGFFGFFAVIPLIFAGAFFADPGSPLVVALALIPLTAPAAMLQLLAIAPEPPWLLMAASLVSLGTFALLATIGAARIFRATLLLYGSRPSISRIISAVTARG